MVAEDRLYSLRLRLVVQLLLLMQNMLLEEDKLAQQLVPFNHFEILYLFCLALGHVKESRLINFPFDLPDFRLILEIVLWLLLIRLELAARGLLVASLPAVVAIDYELEVLRLQQVRQRLVDSFLGGAVSDLVQPRHIQ